MNSSSRFRSLRALGVFVLLAAWFVVSNHCAFSVLQAARTAGEVQEQCCHAQSSSGSHEQQKSSDVCCKSLRVLPLDQGVKLVKTHDAHALFDLLWREWSRVLLPDGAPAVAFAATGPPHALAFAEAVLQRSLLSHAPPLAA